MDERSSIPEKKRRSGNKSANRGRGKAGQPDANEIAFSIVEQATREPDAIVETPEEQPQKNPAAVSLGRLGGLKGGKARAQALTPEQRAEIARKAAEKRWKG